jgi:hypothetical protein
LTSGVISAVCVVIYRAILAPFVILRRCWLWVRRPRLRNSPIARRPLGDVRTPLRPLSNLTSARGRSYRNTARNQDPCLKLLEVNRVQRQSRIQRAINTESYCRSGHPRPSRAWRHCSKRKRRRNAVPRECTICFNNLMSYRFPHRNISASCQHERSVCLSCVAREIKRNFDDNGWTEARCVACQSLLSSNDIAEFAFEEDFVK